MSVICLIGGLIGAFYGGVLGTTWGVAVGTWAGALVWWWEMRAALREFDGSHGTSQDPAPAL
jgi:hypothetical protein